MKTLVALWNRPQTRALVYQTVLVVGLVSLLISTAQTVIDNVHRAGIRTGFGFLGEEAGFAINQTMIHYDHSSSYGRAIVVCFLNTLLLAGLVIVLCTVLGLVLALFRMSSNWLLSKIAEYYVELFRNVPLLLQLFFWYNAALRALPGKRESIDFFGVAYLNIEGLFVPVPIYHPGTVAVFVALGLAFLVAIGVHIWASRRQVRTGQPFPSLWVGLGLVVGVPFLVAAALGFPITWDVPHFERFNFVGGSEVQPEFVAMLLGLTLYNTAFVGEIIRAGIQSVSKGQREAARSIGMRETAIYTKIVIPQARRLIIPPLTNQYLNLTKATALSAALGYPELFWALGGAIQSQTGQVLEIQVLTMSTYLVITAAIAGMMAWYNHRIRLVER